MNQTLPSMTATERDALAAICLLSAFADGQPDDQERERIRASMASAYGEGDGCLPNAVYQRVIFRQTDAAREAVQLGSPELKRLAFDMAVSVCGADGVTNPQEREFLDRLAAALDIAPAAAHTTLDQVDGVLAAPLPPTPPPPVPAASAPAADAERDRQIQASIQNYAVLNGALELLPHGLASAAIIPLQMKMVYEIGKRYGYALDKGHIRDFLATAGVGMTSQIVESFASRLGGRLLGMAGGMVFGRMAGRVMGGIGSTAASAAIGFASTWALGRVAQQYYAGGRTMSAIDLRAVFSNEVASARQSYNQWRPQIEQQARSLNPARVLDLVRGVA